MKAEDHELLRQTQRDSAMGRLLRRYWIPACLSREVAEPNGPPVRVRLLGENLVAFRDSAGRVGLVEEHCAHRGASLFFGRVEAGGLRCLYHGWKYDVTGQCVEMPNEPRGETLRQGICVAAYPCRERAGVVFAYMGPGDDIPELPDLEWMIVPPDHVYVSKRLQRCHFTQGMEGDLDPTHVPFLHQMIVQPPSTSGSNSGTTDTSWAKALLNDMAPTLELVPNEAGMLFATRRSVSPTEHLYRIGQWFMPWYTTIPGWSGDGPLAGHAWVPIDDHHCWVYAWTWHPTRPLSDHDRNYMIDRTDGVYSQLEPGSYRPLRNLENGYVAPGDPPQEQPWRRLRYFQDQDMGITESMGPIYDRTREHLMPGDRFVVHMRSRLIEAAQNLESRQEAPTRDPAAYRLRPLTAKLEASATPWHEAVAPNLRAEPATFIASA